MDERRSRCARSSSSDFPFDTILRIWRRMGEVEYLLAPLTLVDRFESKNQKLHAHANVWRCLRDRKKVWSRISYDLSNSVQFVSFLKQFTNFSRLSPIYQINACFEDVGKKGKSRRVVSIERWFFHSISFQFGWITIFLLNEDNLSTLKDTIYLFISHEN